MKFVRFAAITMVALTLLAACAPAPTATPVPTPVPPTKAPVVASAATPVPPVAAPASSMLALAVSKTALGSIIADSDGKTLYMYTKDTKDTSACYDACATNWPPLLADKIDAQDGVDAKLIGYTKRTDGKMQVTYNGMPLYYWAKDVKPGDTTGQNVGGVWFVLAPDGKVIKPVTLSLAKTNLGSILADSDGKTLYMYTKDTKDTSACYDACATNWPPLLADKIDAMVGVDAKLIGYTKRTDGKMQVTYDGMPLYYFAKDAKPGDTTGQNVGGIWFVLAADGKVIKPAASDTAAQTFTVLVSAEDTTIGAELNAFFPAALHIHVGDTVVWKENSHELHTVTFLGNLTMVPDLLVPVPNAPPGAMMINPQAGFPAGPTDGKYDGSVYVNSGIMGMDPGQALQFSLTFTKLGTYQYVCIVHNTMKMDKTMKMEGTIIVEDAKTTIPTQAEVSAQAKKEMDALMAKVPDALKAANAAIKPAVKNADGTMTYYVGMGYASGQIDLTAFFPSKLTAKPGDTVVWTLGEMNMAPHTLTFLNGVTEPDLIVPQPQPNGPPLLLFNPAVALPQNADKPLTNKGIYSSGIVSPDAPGAHTFALKVGDFVGSLEFLCLLHDANGMKGTLTVSK